MRNANLIAKTNPEPDRSVVFTVPARLEGSGFNLGGVEMFELYELQRARIAELKKNVCDLILRNAELEASLSRVVPSSPKSTVEV